MEVANYFIKESLKSDDPVTHLRLQKLTYFAHGYYLAIYGPPLLTEPVYAWKFGPVIASLYHKLKSFGNRKIETLQAVFDPELDGDRIPLVDSEREREVATILDITWEKYEGLHGSTLTNLTHQKGTPWSQVFREGMRSVIIPDSIIRDHFRGLLNNARA